MGWYTEDGDEYWRDDPADVVAQVAQVAPANQTVQTAQALPAAQTAQQTQVNPLDAAAREIGRAHV